MRLLLKFSVLPLLCGLFMMSSVAQTPADKSLPLDFPEIEGWEKGDITEYSPARFGYSIGYQSDEGGSMTVYVYNGGVSKISDGVGDEHVKNEINSAKNDIRTFGEAGYFENVLNVKDETVTLGGTGGKIKALYSLFNFKLRGEEVDSEIYLFGYKNKFIKIRSTRPKSDDGAKNTAVVRFLAAMDNLFSK